MCWITHLKFEYFSRKFFFIFIICMLFIRIAYSRMKRNYQMLLWLFRLHVCILYLFKRINLYTPTVRKHAQTHQAHSKTKLISTFNVLKFLFFFFVAEEIYLNSRTFLWPHELEQVLELSGARLNVVRENLEIALK